MDDVERKVVLTMNAYHWLELDVLDDCVLVEICDNSWSGQNVLLEMSADQCRLLAQRLMVMADAFDRQNHREG